VWETGRGKVTVFRGAGFGNGVVGTGYGLGEAGESNVAVGEPHPGSRAASSKMGALSGAARQNGT
jgi:hypothetical protein